MKVPMEIIHLTINLIDWSARIPDYNLRHLCETQRQITLFIESKLCRDKLFEKNFTKVTAKNDPELTHGSVFLAGDPREGRWG